MVVPKAKGDNAVDGFLQRADLTKLRGFDAVAAWSERQDQRAIRQALAKRNGAILSLIVEKDMADRCHIERHLCVDTTAAGAMRVCWQ